MQNEIQLLYEKIKYELTECHKNALDHLKHGQGITSYEDYKFIQARILTIEETMKMVRTAYAKITSEATGDDENE